MLRQVIVTIMGNVDSGKSQTIDTIKKTSIVASEPGRITQSIKAYSLSLGAIKNICKDLLDIAKIKVPGLLVIDTPGHAAFSNLRKRGGSLADIAVLVIDINEGIKPQTIECIEILKENKTPFIVALNKIDLINGFQQKDNSSLTKTLNLQSESVKKVIEDKLYSIVARLYEFGFNSERFDRIEDFTKNIALIPISAKTGEGIPELLMMITGLAQRFLEVKLEYDPKAPAEGTILEIQEEKGLGITLDTIIYKGKIKLNDTIVIGTLNDPIATKVKAMFIPEKSQLKSIKEAEAAIGIKILAPNTKDVIAGMPLKVANKDLEKIKIEIKETVEEITFELDEEGIVVKADNIGSLEALINLLKEKNVKIKRASIGEISKKDITEAEANSKPLHKLILGFNIREQESSNIKIITHNVIYTLIEKFEEWYKQEKESIKNKQLKDLMKPCKIKILEGHVFRQSNPAVVGVDILLGKLKPGTPLMKDSNKITEAKSIQNEGKNISEAEEGKSYAVSLTNVTVGRQIKEGDILYSDMPEPHFRAYKDIKEDLSANEKQVLNEIAEIKRKISPGWGA